MACREYRGIEIEAHPAKVLQTAGVCTLDKLHRLCAVHHTVARLNGNILPNVIVKLQVKLST